MKQTSSADATDGLEDGGPGDDALRCSAVRPRRPRRRTGRSQGQDGAGLAHQHRRALARSAAARRHRDARTISSMRVHDGLIKNFREQQYDHLALGRALRICRGRQERDVSPAAGHQIPRRLAGHAGRMSNGASSTTAAPGPRCCTTRPRASRSSMTTPSAFTSTSRSSIFRSCSARRNVCGAGWVVPAEILSEGRAGRVSAEADRRRALQARVAAAGHTARFRGL